MKQSLFTVDYNVKLTFDVYKMRLVGDTSDITKPGQFINIKLDGFYLRRPISVFDCDESAVTIIYKVVGEGTEYMASLGKGKTLDVLTGLGNGFDVEKCGQKVLLIGGGVGVPPMFYLAKKLLSAGKTVSMIMGFNKESEVFAKEDFEALGIKTLVTTVDGSVGIKGFVTNAMDEVEYDCICTCGPEPMLKAVYDASKTTGFFSFEERMGCGFGACMGCSCKTKYGNKRICKDGPILVKEEIIW
ncbi:MAG: dihydroorotate dehydrogenase electron transfer subunit [Clostridia bacterium]|nr:dihydroorotate dehydrogenase electron transfer subunit [Clostridia bacterium]